jgi:hypothetical protein
MFKQTQRSFAGGWLDRELMGRTDLAKYYNGASKIENFLVRRQGNLAKRRGTDLAADLTGILGTGRQLGAYRLVPVSQSREKGYYVLLADRRAFLLDTARGILCADGKWRRAAPPYEAPEDGEATPSEINLDDLVPCAARIGTVPYETLAAAITASNYGDIIQLGEDATLSADTTFKGVLDLNGHTVTVNANATIVFASGNGNPCGVVSGRKGGTLKWEVAGTHDKNGLKHQSGVFTMRDVTADYTGTGSLLYSVSANASDRVELTRCTLSTKTGSGVVDLEGTLANPAKTDVTDVDEYGCSGYSWFAAGCLVRGCSISMLTNEADPSHRLFRSGSYSSSDARIISFVSGRLLAYDEADGYRIYRTAADGNLRVYGGIILCGSINGYFGSRMVRGLSYERVPAVYIADGTLEAKSKEIVDRERCYSYAPEGEPRYTAERNVWKAPPWEVSGGITTGDAPYSVTTPYSDEELDELDLFQSGDTVFIAHAAHAPATLALDADAGRLLFARMKFNASEWKRPSILSSSENVHKQDVSLSYSGNTKTENVVAVSGTTRTVTVYVNDVEKASSSSQLVPRTVRYCATYVKDGLESPPSIPVSVTYGAPWEEGGKITLTLSKGDNAEDPDYYNIYKSESTGWGLVGSTWSRMRVDVKPKAVLGYSFTEGAALSPGSVPSAFVDGETVASTEQVNVLGSAPEQAYASGSLSVGEAKVRAGVGGLRFGVADGGSPAAAVLEFGLNSGVRMDGIDLALDAHALSYVRNQDGTLDVKDRRILSGKTVTVKVTHQATASYSAATLVATASATLAAAEADPGQSTWTGPSTLSLGTLPADALLSAVDALVGASAVRRVSIPFAALATGRQVVRIEISCADENGDPCEFVMCGLSLSLSGSGGNTFDDEYVTPNMSITPPSSDESFAHSGDYPSCVGIYQQRLIFAASANRPSAFCMSAIGDLYTFAAHESIREDDAIDAELAATEFPRINHLVSARDLVMLCDGGEWKVSPVSGNAITYKTISATLQSSIGSAKWLKPLTVGNEVVFAERTGMALRSVAYNFASDGYESQDLTVLAGNIFAGNRIVRMCYKQHPDSTVVCALADGAIATLVYMREHEVMAWSHHALGGGWLARDVATSKALNGGTTDVAIVAERDGVVQLWAVRPDDPSPTVAAQACLDGCRTMTGAEATAEGAWLEGWVAVDLLTGIAYASKSALQAVSSYESRSYLCGFPIRSELVTVRPEPSPQDTIQFEIKNLKSVEARTISAGRYTVRSFAAAAGVKPTVAKTEVPVSAGTVELLAADVATTVLGANTADGRVQIVHEDIWPMQLLLLSANYEIQPLSNSAG